MDQIETKSLKFTKKMLRFGYVKKKKIKNDCKLWGIEKREGKQNNIFKLWGMSIMMSFP